MTTAGVARQHDPEPGEPLELSAAQAANDRAHRTAHGRSRRCSFAVDPGGQELEPGLRRPGEGERALMRAVLADAIKCLAGRGRDGQPLMLEARRWVASRDMRWPFSFENICCVLDLDPPTLRRRVGVPARDGTEQRPSSAPRANGRVAARLVNDRVTAAAHGPSTPEAPSSALAVDDRPEPGLDAVTPREQEIIRQVAFGLRNAEVAVKLHITRRTVTTHLANIFRKLGIHERRELFGFALRTAII
jgi:DNA-binding CsgD family transcriptional regulator